MLIFSPGHSIKIFRVDMNGFASRDHHPKPSDVSRTGVVTEVQVSLGTRLYTCTMTEGDILELADFELQP